MKKLVAKINFSANGKNYIIGDEVDIKDMKAIVKLNEKGFIEPLDYKDLVILERELTKEKSEL
jgi:ribosomal protein S18